MTTASEIMEKASKQAANGPSAPGARPQVAERSSLSSPSGLGQARQVGGIRLTPEQSRARRARSIAIALALGAFVLIIFAVTVVKLRSGVLTGPDYMRPVQTSQ
jgi:hypothetical protein